MFIRYCSVVVCAVLLITVRAGGPFITKEMPSAAIANVQDTTSATGENNRVVAGLLAVFLGPFGAHRLYLGTNTKVAVLYGATFGGFGVLPLLDLGHLIFSREIEPFHNNQKVFMWQRHSATPP